MTGSKTRTDDASCTGGSTCSARRSGHGRQKTGGKSVLDDRPDELAVTASVHSHVMVDETELDYDVLPAKS